MADPISNRPCRSCAEATQVDSPCRGVRRRWCPACGRVEAVVCESSALEGTTGDDAVALVVDWGGGPPRASDVRALRQLLPELAEEADLLESLAGARECRLPEIERQDAADLVQRATELGLRVRGF